MKRSVPDRATAGRSVRAAPQKGDERDDSAVHARAEPKPRPGFAPTQVVGEIIGMLAHGVARAKAALVSREWNEIVRSKHPCRSIGSSENFAKFLVHNNMKMGLLLRATQSPQVLEPDMPIVGVIAADWTYRLRVQASAEQLATFVKGGLVVAPSEHIRERTYHKRWWDEYNELRGASLTLYVRLTDGNYVEEYEEDNGDKSFDMWLFQTRNGALLRMSSRMSGQKTEKGTMEDMRDRVAAEFEAKTGVALADAQEGSASPQKGKFTWWSKHRSTQKATKSAVPAVPAPGDDLPIANISPSLNFQEWAEDTQDMEVESVTVHSVNQDGSAVLEVAVSDFGYYLLRDTRFEVSSDVHNDEWERRMKKTDPEGVCFADGDVPSDLVEALQSGVDKLAARPDKDYHPGSDDVVLDHVHPALYPFIKGTSDFVPSDDLKSEDASGDPRGSVDGAEKLIKEPNSGRWGRTYENSIYQWLPTYFDISANGKVSIRGDINNLRPRDEHQGLYESLGLLFEQFVPDLEAVLSYADLITFPEEGYWADFDKKALDPDPHVEVKHRLAGQALQVIPKIVDYELKPGQSYEGVWHVEGMSHENIVATCLYILDRDDAIEGGHLLFKRAFTTEEGDTLFDTGQDRDVVTQRFINDGMVPLGQVQTPRGRRVVFPNSHVHRVAKMTNTGSALARRRIIAFFVVDPLVRIVSTQECPDQRSKLSLEAAKEHRLELMRERRLHKQDWNVRHLSLCEH